MATGAMKSSGIRFGHFASLILAGLTAVAGCGQNESSGGGEPADAHRGDSAIADASPTGSGGAPGLGGAVAVGGSGGTPGLGGAVAVGGSMGAGGTTGGSLDASAAVACEQGPVTGDRCTSLPAGKVCRLGDSCLGGCAQDCSCKDGFWSCERVCRDCMGSKPAPSSKGPLVCSVFCDYEGPRLDAGAEATDGGAATFDGGSLCSGPDPSKVTCLVTSNQCVPSSCSCNQSRGWTCTTDCRSSTLPLCDLRGQPDAATPDVAQDAAATEALSAANYACRDDSDCCTVVDTCMDVAYLYSKAPGATGRPSIPSASGTCLACIPPAVQVRCELGQCVGEKIPTGVDYASPIRKDHCGSIALPDAGLSLSGHAPAGSQQTSWGC